MANVIIKKLKQPIVVHIYFDKKAKIWYNYITLRIFKLKTEYNNAQSRVVIPAEVEQQKQDEIKELAIKAFKAIDGKGLSRVDFFVEKETNKIYINEINTMPGFTKISMYPKLFEAVRITYTELLDKLIENTK